MIYTFQRGLHIPYLNMYIHDRQRYRTANMHSCSSREDDESYDETWPPSKPSSAPYS